MQVSSKTDRPKDSDFSTRLLGSNASRNNLEPGQGNSSQSTSANDRDNHGSEAGKDLPLKDMIVYPEIYSNETNISETSYGYLQKLGAKIEKRINKKCNVIIWKDGSIKTIEKAREYGIPIVNSLWLEDCVENFHLADLKKYAKNLPTETEMPFLAFHETKKRKTFDAIQDEDDPFHAGIPPELLKPTLKKRKKTPDDDEDYKKERTTLRFDDDSDWKKKDGKNPRRSNTAKSATLGSWLLTVNESDKKEGVFGSRNKAEKTSSKGNSPPHDSANLNIERIFQKKKAEENSAKVRNMILGYARSGTLGGDDSFDVEADIKENDEEKDDESNKSYSMDSGEDEEEKEEKWSSRFDDDNSQSKSKNFMSRSMTVEEKSSSLFDDESKHYSFKTRVMLREGRQNTENEQVKEKSIRGTQSDKKDNTFDIGIRAREELMKKEGANFGRISDLWSKYTGKVDPKSAEKKDKEEPKAKSNSDNDNDKEERKTLKSRLEDKTSNKDKVKEVPERRTSARKAAEKKKAMEEEFSGSEEASDSDEDIVVTKRGKDTLSKRLMNYNKEETSKKVDDKKLSSVKLETPAKMTRSTAELAPSEQKTRYASDAKTPQTKQAFSLSKSSIVGKYLGSASSNTSALQKSSTIEYDPLDVNISSAKRKKSVSDKSDSEESDSSPRGLRDNGVRNKNLITSLESQRSKNGSKSNKKGSFDEEKEEELMTKTIKKRTDDKKEEFVMLSGLAGKSYTRAQEFCKKFGLKPLDDELRNLSRSDFLVYEGNEVPKNYRVAFTMMRGKPIVNLDWIEESLRDGKVTDYKEHEYCYSPESRTKLLDGLRFYIDKEFEGLSGNMVLKKDLVNLLELGNGRILDNVRSCDFCVMKRVGRKSGDVPAHVKIITSQWIIDSIIEGKLLGTDKVNYSF